MYILNAEEMRAADAHAIQNLSIPSVTLMENAASRVAEIVLQRNLAAGPSILIVCGKGNNGGDGLALARLLRNAGRHASVL
ncbi:MAG TPA: NAD(P)H-hydrate epimerase, partial [Anaerolineales bacterium]|nr:NAD(P)H-hydrate epimerase [Anaerolineales bacterium]